MLTYFTMPSPTTTFSGIAEWFNPLFEEFYPWALLAIGVILTFSVIAWVIHMFKIQHH